MVVTNFDPLEDVPELLVPDTQPQEEAPVNPLDAEAPANLTDGESVPRRMRPQMMRVVRVSKVGTL